MQDVQETGGSRLQAERLRVFLRMHLSSVRAEPFDKLRTGLWKPCTGRMGTSTGSVRTDIDVDKKNSQPLSELLSAVPESLNPS